MNTKFNKLLNQIFSIFTIATLTLYVSACAGIKEGESTQSQSSILGLLGLSLNEIQSGSCEGKKLSLFTDPLPPESEIPVLQIGESIVLDRSAHLSLESPAWDLSIGTEYEGFYERFERDMKTSECHKYKPLFPGYHYIKLCNTVNGNYSCVARGFIKVEGAMNKAPLAALTMPTPMVFLGQAINLDMSNSTDPENDSLKFTWRMLEQPPTSTVQPIVSDAAVQPFTPDVPGRYVLVGYALDGYENPLRFLDQANSVVVASVHSRIEGNVAPTMVMVMNPPNPTAGNSIRFDASASTDPDDPVLTLHSWFIAVQLEDGSWDFFDVQDTFTPGTLRVGKNLAAGNYWVGACLADYVPREAPNEAAQSCWDHRFTVVNE
ncbi:hypothetical protein AB3N59_16065 [Leptospira sp. WS92.C1]